MGLGLALDDDSLPHMAIGLGRFEGEEVRVARVSFTGERGYELSIRADRAPSLWMALRHEGKAFDAALMGLEALTILRAEKGYVIIGKDTDGLTRPMDLGVDGPLRNKKTEFIGKRSLMTEDARRGDRRQLVGLDVLDNEGPLAMGAHGVEPCSGKSRSIGYVTSSYPSPTLGRPIALALIERGACRLGEIIDVRHFGAIRKARIAEPCAFDKEGLRLHA
jgi:sarcosine oxidase subunit alpha